MEQTEVQLLYKSFGSCMGQVVKLEKDSNSGEYNFLNSLPVTLLNTYIDTEKTFYSEIEMYKNDIRCPSDNIP